jgi:hypothetical protein
MRLSKEDRARFSAEYGERIFEPMKGRPMREYVRLPEELLIDAGKRGPWSIDRWGTQKESSQRLRARNSIVASQKRRLFGSERSRHLQELGQILEKLFYQSICNPTPDSVDVWCAQFHSLI